MTGGLTLRRKLFGAFVALAVIALLATGVALYTTIRWQATNDAVQTHYKRSLLLERVRAETFQALKEVDDALNGDVADARRDFERALRPAERDFLEWAALADTQVERREVATVRAAHQRLVTNARQLFAIADRNPAEAARIADNELDTKDLENFRILTERGVAADRQRRRSIVDETERVRNTTQVMVAIAVISIISLILLISAFLAQDLFRPLRELGTIIDRLRLGELDARAETNRDDEIGALGACVNALAGSLQQRASLDDGGDSWRDQPSKVTLHRLVQSLRGRLRDLGDADPAIGEAEQIAAAIGKFTAIGFPLDLNLEQIRLPAFLHELIGRFRQELADRSVALEISPVSEASAVLADRLKLREALCEAIRNALDALPEEGGRIGIRTLAGDPGFIRIEVADDGKGMSDDLIAQAMEADPFRDVDRPKVGLALSRSIAEAHGGRLKVMSEPGSGTVVQFSLPHRQ